MYFVYKQKTRYDAHSATKVPVTSGASNCSIHPNEVCKVGLDTKAA